ncbi:Na(+)/H(+) antiporter subunit C [Saxibacter everestensis]|uniref:Na(+)/H(+) antiporter subunit C n=1 Tax=Saxibacter everestensis TaxID=2909229 RepID=A0ABY8QUM4_9MICO|nr:Na(+)/H(+) antiporter subunit C [Brevibacteriaceae bacterium ZFBP1038]
MTVPLILVVLIAVMYSCGIFLLLERSLTRVLLGFLLLGNATNILLLMAGGPSGRAPVTDGKNFSTEGMNDPLPQALILTAIVITFGISAFLLAMIYRSWRLARADEIQDDTDDVLLAESAASEAELDVEFGEAAGDDDTEFGDEAEDAVEGAPDIDDDGTPAQRARNARKKETGAR